MICMTKYPGFPSEQVTLLASDQPAERQPTRGFNFDLRNREVKAFATLLLPH